MIKDLVVSGNIGLLRTEKQFVLLINDEMYGPFKNKDWKKIVRILKEEK